ncbi:MAG: (deoxy)nucleoside triphosphate pyrophosphohydrolase [Mycoplasmatales bacterium]|nr:(deoxy)nucleoside triphosphate pyrophosphohydrolase [Mycoplasmatales bacterium]
MKKLIKVVAAIIEKDDKILSMQRNNKGFLKNKWEFPGGKIEKGEEISEAIIREIKEELDVEIKAKNIVHKTNYEYPSFNIELTFVECELIDNEKNIKLNVHKNLKWLNKYNLKEVDWAPADVEMVDKLIKIK